MKNKNFLLLIIFFVIGVSFTIYGESDSNLIKQTRDLGEFTSIQHSGNFDVNISIGDQYLVFLEGTDEESLNMIMTSVSGDVLTIKCEDCKKYLGPNNITVYVQLPEVEDIKVSGSGRLTCDKIQQNEISLKVTGSGDIEINELYVNRLDAEIAGSGSITAYQKSEKIIGHIYGSGNLILEGYVKKAEYTITGSGKVMAENLIHDNCYSKIYGSGDLYLTSRGKLEVEIFGNGNIYYKGNPEIYMNSKGSGKIYKLKEEN